jgi:hypothetical protein
MLASTSLSTCLNFFSDIPADVGNPQVNATYAYSAISCWVDWTLAIVPVFIVWNLQMNIRTKISVAMILALGAMFVSSYVLSSFNTNTPSSASTATIIRIPYVHGLTNTGDFLYATTDVAIWSTAETGMGLAASSFATLRPLFRNFLSRTRLWGGTSSQTRSSPWPGASAMNGTANGYIRSRSKGGIEEFGLRSDIGKGNGTTTVIESDVDGMAVDMERGERGGRGPTLDINVKRKASGGKMGRAGWNNSVSKLTDVSSDDGEPNWASGIRKTTVTQVARR